MAETIFTQSSTTCLASGIVFRCQASKVDYPTTHNLRFNSKKKISCFSSLPDQNQAFRFQHETRRKKNMAIYASIPPDAPNQLVDSSSHGIWEFIVPSSPTDPKVWIFGSIVTAILSLTKGKWGPVLLLRDKIEKTIDEVEKVADVVEEVAEKVEKVAEEVANSLPEGKLKDAAEFVEQIAEDVDKSVHIAEAALEKVEDMEKKLESFVESTAANQEKVVTTVQATDQK